MPLGSIPTPFIIPLRIPKIGESKRNVDTKTLIELSVDSITHNIEIFYTLDGTKPQPHQKISQGSKLYKYGAPFCLPAGKITIKAIACNLHTPSMCSNIVTRDFQVSECTDVGEKCKIKRVVKSKKPKRPSKEKKMENHSSDIPCQHVEKVASDYSCDLPSVEESHASKAVSVEDPVNTDEGLEENRDSMECTTDISEIPQDIDQAVEKLSITALTEDSPSHSMKESQKTEEKDSCQEKAPTIESSPIATYEMPLQHCFFCSKVNCLTAHYCDKCGNKLIQQCSVCKEHNPSFAKFCQHCGDKLSPASEDSDEEQVTQMAKTMEDAGIMAKPDAQDYGIQNSPPPTVHKYVQTSAMGVKLKSFGKKLSSSTPGRGYWRQQIDHICNHIKAHAYNNLNFRKLIGEPSIGRLLSADVIESEGDIIIRVTFSSMSSKQLVSSE